MSVTGVKNAFLLTWSALTQIHGNKTKYLDKKKFQLSPDLGLDTKMTAAFHCVLGQQYGERYVMWKRFKNLAIVYFNEKEHNSDKFLLCKTEKSSSVSKSAKYVGYLCSVHLWIFILALQIEIRLF